MRDAMIRPPHGHHPRRPAAGFTLVEVTLTMLVIVMVLGGVLALFDANSELARVQTHVANMQQSLRVAQYEMVRNVRMTGRGPLPQGNLPGGAAIAVDNNVPAARHISTADSDSPLVVEDTDILTIRGVFTTPLYQFNPTAGVYSLNRSPVDASEGSLIINNRTPTGIPQDLEAMKEAIDRTDEHTEAMLVVSPLDDAIYAVVEIDNRSTYTEETIDGVTEVTQVNLQFKITGGENTVAYALLSSGGSYPINMPTAAFAGLLEEYRYYIREVREVAGDPSSQLHPRLSRARMYPGTEVAHLNAPASFAADIADNVLDLQIALGIDTDGDDLITENEPPDGADDWLYNSDGDDDTDTTKWVGTAGALSDLFYVRINTLVRTDRPDRGFEAELLTTIEDKDYSASPGDAYNDAHQRAYRRRLMQSVVDTRNMS